MQVLSETIGSASMFRRNIFFNVYLLTILHKNIYKMNVITLMTKYIMLCVLHSLISCLTFYIK